jgi:hypothetical protein
MLYIYGYICDTIIDLLMIIKLSLCPVGQNNIIKLEGKACEHMENLNRQRVRVN